MENFFELKCDLIKKKNNSGVAFHFLRNEKKILFDDMTQEKNSQDLKIKKNLFLG